MKNEFIDKLSSAGEKSLSNLQELSAINSRTVRKLAELQMTLVTLGIDGTVKQVQSLAGARDYSDLLSVQSTLAMEYGNRFIEISREAAGLLSASQEDFVAWVKKSFDAVSGESAAPSAKSRSATKAGTSKRSTARKAA